MLYLICYSHSVSTKMETTKKNIVFYTKAEVELIVSCHIRYEAHCLIPDDIKKLNKSFASYINFVLIILL